MFNLSQFLSFCQFVDGKLKNQLIHEKNLNIYRTLFVYTILWLTITFTFFHPYVPTCASMSHRTPAKLFVLVM